jgi:cytoskeletal protein CcmA (bactofilin family)
MLLTRLRRRAEDDRGAAMAAVIGMLAMSLIVSTVVVGTVVTTTGYTTSTRASVQAQAAAEAGIAAARAGLIAGTCSARAGKYQNAAGVSPTYTATIWVASGTTWVRSCPSGTGTKVRILSSGYAQAEGVGAEGGDVKHIEAILSAVTTTTGVTASGPAIYAYRSDSFTGSGTLASVNGSRPSVYIKKGNVECSGSSSGPADWVVDDGNLTASGSCNIGGNAWASKLLALSGNVEITGYGVGQAISIAGSSRIGGSAWSTTSITIEGSAKIVGNATGASLTLNGSAGIDGDAWIYGNAYLDSSTKIKGKLTAKTRNGSGGSVGSQQLYNPSTPPTSPYVTPTKPVVPNWVDYAYKAADWPGYTVVALSGSCSTTSYTNALTTIGTNPGVIDARACSASGKAIQGTFELGGNTKIAINNNLVILANGFEMKGSAGFTSTASAKLWLITPDVTANSSPDCPVINGKTGVFDISGSFGFQSTISTMIYTPCAAAIGSSTTIRGQIWGGFVSVGGSALIGYVPIGLPGVNLSTGTTTTTTTSESSRVVESIRNVTQGN